MRLEYLLSGGGFQLKSLAFQAAIGRIVDDEPGRGSEVQEDDRPKADEDVL